MQFIFRAKSGSCYDGEPKKWFGIKSAAVMAVVVVRRMKSPTKNKKRSLASKGHYIIKIDIDFFPLFRFTQPTD